LLGLVNNFPGNMQSFSLKIDQITSLGSEMPPHTVVLDIGKTQSKVSLWRPDGELVERRVRPNERGAGAVSLDAIGIEAWLAEALTDFARRAPVGAIIPVGHGAAAAILRGETLVAAMDYETEADADERARYDAERDPFALTGSPALPNGLNLGFQLHLLERGDARALDGATILPWPQYWAWLLSGVAASEVTSLGCHSDLWLPLAGRPSALAVRRGWAGRLPPLRGASDVLGSIRPEWALRTGLPRDVKIHCGLHDSNAALVAARAFSEIAGMEATVLSTGTWFVAMRTPGEDALLSALPETRDCLVNVDVHGRPTPSARFMGGREIEALTGDAQRIDIAAAQPSLVAAVANVLNAGAMVLPSFAPGVGPFPRAKGGWANQPTDDFQRRAAISLYVALVADATLDLVGARERIVIEGRFAQAQVFARALAALRPGSSIYIADAQNDVSFGALRLLNPDLAPRTRLSRVTPLEHDMGAYRAAWRALAQQDGDG
jgi:sugar (pentulose or hexulose) kinase